MSLSMYPSLHPFLSTLYSLSLSLSLSPSLSLHSLYPPLSPSLPILILVCWYVDRAPLRLHFAYQDYRRMDSMDNTRRRSAPSPRTATTCWFLSRRASITTWRLLSTLLRPATRSVQSTALQRNSATTEATVT